MTPSCCEYSYFVLLVKLWAKKSDIISSASPKDGLSGYGVVLMCLFYLMETNQIPRLDSLSDGYHHTEVIDPVPPELCRLASIGSNFTKFLAFYDRNSQFHRKRQIVSLISNPPQSAYNHDVIINMYDFIDKTNPGRLTREFDDKFFGAINGARVVMQDG